MAPSPIPCASGQRYLPFDDPSCRPSILKQPPNRAPRREFFCPPPGSRKGCGPEPSQDAQDAVIALGENIQNVASAALQRAYEIPRGALGAAYMRQFQALLRRFLESVEALRLLACTWVFRLCWLPEDSASNETSSFLGASAWWLQWHGLLAAQRRAFAGLERAALGLLLQGHFMLPPPEVPSPLKWASTDTAAHASELVVGLFEYFRLVSEPLLATVLANIDRVKVAHGPGWSRPPFMRDFSVEFFPAAEGTEMWALYPSSAFGPSAGVCRAAAGEPVHRRAQEAEASYGSRAFDMSGVRMRHRTVTEALDQIAAAGHGLSYQLLNLGAMDGRCLWGGPSTDPANCLLAGNVPMYGSFERSCWGGVAVEADPKPQLFELFGGREDVKLVTAPIFPENVSDVFAGYELPQAPGSLDLLKIDIDSFDCDIVATMLRTGPLAESPPKLLYIDINPHIPPPFLYRTVSMSQGRVVPFQALLLLLII